MEMPIEVLRVEQSGISKEIGRFRPCDNETRSLYCREWAQYIYKKHFVWSAKTMDEIVPEPTIPNTLKAGKYQINFITAFDHQGDPVDQAFKKEQSSLLAKKFETLSSEWTTSTTTPEESLLERIITGCKLWMTLPSGFMGLPEAFEPVEFNPFPDAIPLVEDLKDPSQLLDPLIIERQALCLPSDCFHLLKNLTGDILLSHTNPTCNHSKPESKTPADLEMDRAIFNEHEATAVTQALKELSLALDRTWHPLNQFLDKLTDLEKRRDRLMGKGCQEGIDAFFASQKFVSFVDSWTKIAPQYKSKKSTEEEIKKVDQLFYDHLDLLRSHVKAFLDDYVQRVLVDIRDLTSDLWKIVLPTIYDIGQRLATRDNLRGSEASAKLLNEFKTLDKKCMKNLDSTKEVEIAKDRIVSNMTVKLNEYLADIDGLEKLYKDNLRPSLSGRLDKLNNKDFKKKVKKVESGYYSVRQTFRYEVTEKIFPEALFCKFALICLGPLLQEGEMAEALTIETEVKRFMEAYKDLWRQRNHLLDQFEDGVHTGRRELAGVLGKLFLKEGMRIQGDNLALKRQNLLLKSMGMEVPATNEKKSNKKKSSSGTASPAQQLEPVMLSPFKKAAAVKKSDTPVSPPVKEDGKNDADTKASTKVKPFSPVTKTKSSAPTTPTVESTLVTKKAQEKQDTPEIKKATSPTVAKAEEKPVVPEVKKPNVLTIDISDKKKPVEVKPPIQGEKPVEVKKPVVKKPEVKKPVVVEPKKVEIKKVEPPKKPSAPRPKQKSSKIPAPAPILEPRVEPVVPVEKKKKPTEKPKKSSEKEVRDFSTIITSVADTNKVKEPVKKVEEPSQEEEEPVDEKLEEKVDVSEPVLQWNNTAGPVKSVEPIQDWNDIVKTVTPVQPEVQDWNAIVSQVQSVEENKKPVAEEPTPWNQTETGWATVAAKKATVEVPWSSSEASPVQDETNWGTNNATNSWIEKSVRALDQATSGSPTPSWNTVSDKPKISAPPGWGEAVEAEKPKVSAPPGWGVPAEVEKPKVSAPPGWGVPETPSGWSVSEATPTPSWAAPAEEVKRSSWSASPATEKTSLASWNTFAEKVEPTRSEKASVNTRLGWNKPAAVNEKPWSEPVATTSQDNDGALGGWERPTAWGEKKSTENNPAPSRSAPRASATNTTNWRETTPPAKNTNWRDRQTSAGWEEQPKWQEEKATPPPPPAAISAPLVSPHLDEPLRASNKPPGLANTEKKIISITPSIPPPFGLASSQLQNSSQAQFQEPLPHNIGEMDHNMIIAIAQNLHKENGSLISCVYGLQQEMQMMTSRYAEIMALAREREAQQMTLYESRKQTELEEVRRYVLSLEARLKQMEEKNDRVTAGFGNQDLFAGYRENMRPKQQRKNWQKGNHVVRCGNCGESGHESSECTTECRYCDSKDHLSESCPMK